MAMYSQGSLRASNLSPLDGRSSYLSQSSMRESSPIVGKDNGMIRGGVGLVFRKDDGPTPSSFLIVSEILGGGPAAKSGMIRVGDRLRKIDGVELGSAPEEESPQLPGPHGSPVTLTLERPSRGSFFDPTVGILSYNIKLTRSSNFFPDKLQSTADARNSELAKKERESRYEARYGAGGAGWYSSGYEKLALMAASMAGESTEGDRDELRSTPSQKKLFEKPMATMPPMVDSTAFGRQPELSDFDGDGLLGQAEEKVAKDEVEKLKKYVAALQEEVADKRTVEMKTKALEQDLRQEQLMREKLEMQLTKEGLRERQLEEEVAALRNEDREVDLKVLVRGKMDQLVREKEILLADLRHQQVQHRAEKEAMQERLQQLQREKDELKIDLRIEADNERNKQQERYQEYHSKTTTALKALAQDLADAVREKEEAKAALSKFRVGDGVLWEEENYSLKDKNSDLKTRLVQDRLDRDEAVKKADQLAKEVVRLRAELKREGRSVPGMLSTAGDAASPPATRAAPPPDFAMASASPETLRTSTANSPPAVRHSPAAAQRSPPEEANPPRARTIDSVVLGSGAADKTDEIMSLYLNGAEKTVVRDVPRSPSEPRHNLIPEELVDPDGEEGQFPLGDRAQLIEVVVAKARNLPATGKPQEAANYVVVSFKGVPIGTTSSKRGSLPVWNQTFRESAAEKALGLVSIVLYQQSQDAGESTCVGYVAVPLERVMQSGVEEGWYDLLDQDNQPVGGDGGSAEALVRVSCSAIEKPQKSMSGWVRCQEPGSAKDAPVHAFVWQLDPYAGIVRSAKGMATATEIGSEEWRLPLEEWEVVEDQAAVRSIAGKLQNGVDGFCFVLSKKQQRETLLVEVTSEARRMHWVAALEANTARASSPAASAERVIEHRMVDASTAVEPEVPAAVVDVWVLAGRNLPLGLASGLVAEVAVGRQHFAAVAEDGASGGGASWNESVQLGVRSVEEEVSVRIREPGPMGATVGVARLGTAARAGAGDGWVGQDGWVPLQDVASVQDEASPAMLRLHVGLRELSTQPLSGETGPLGWMERADAVEPRKAFAVLDPYSQELRLFADKEAAALGEQGRLAGQARKAPLARSSVRSAEVTRLDTVPSHDGSVMLAVEPAEGEAGDKLRLVAPSEDEYVRWKNALNRVARSPTKQRLVPKATPQPSPAKPEPAAPLPPAAEALPREVTEIAPAVPVPQAPAKQERPVVGLLDIELKVPKALLEVFVFRAQDLPVDALRDIDRPRVWGVIRAGDETCTTMKLDASSGAVLWDEVFQLGARGEASDLVTVILWAGSASGAGEPVCIGHIAVPISRVQASGSEEGWYEVRDRTGQIVKGGKGASMIRAGIAYRPVPKELAKGRARMAEWLVMECRDEEGGEAVAKRVVGVLNPFSEQLQAFESEDDAREGKAILALTCLPGSHAEKSETFTNDLRSVVSAERRDGVWEDGFVIRRKDTTVHCIAEETRHVNAWLQALAAAGTGAQERREQRKKAKAGAEQTTKEKEPVTPKKAGGDGGGETVEVVVERARNLKDTYTKGAVKGFLCSVQLRDQKHATSLSQQADTPIWKERFSVAVVDATADLATVMLHVQAEGGSPAPECIGHIAVPVSRIAKKGKEEGWYDVTSAASSTGELLGNSAGKAGLLVSFRYKGKK